MPSTRYPTPTPAHRVVLVNGNPDMLRLLDTVLGAGHYDMVFVPPDGRAYEQIRGVQPDLVVLRTELDSPAALQVLTMLKLDPATRHIPVLTVAAEPGHAAEPEPDGLPPAHESLAAEPARDRLN